MYLCCNAISSIQYDPSHCCFSPHSFLGQILVLFDWLCAIWLAHAITFEMLPLPTRAGESAEPGDGSDSGSHAQSDCCSSCHSGPRPGTGWVTDSLSRTRSKSLWLELTVMLHGPLSLLARNSSSQHSPTRSGSLLEWQLQLPTLTPCQESQTHCLGLGPSHCDLNSLWRCTSHSGCWTQVHSTAWLE